jgi:hypothetical protein
VIRPLELRTPLWFLTPKGEARAYFLICDEEQDLLWICFIQSGPYAGQCWTFRNSQIRIMPNETIGRVYESK